MTQFDFGTIDPFVIGGVTLTSWINQWRDAVHSMHRGPARPDYVVPGMAWINDTGGDTSWVVMVYMGPAIGDVPVFTYDTTTGRVSLIAATVQAQATVPPVVRWYALSNPANARHFLAYEQNDGSVRFSAVNDDGSESGAQILNRNGTMQVVAPAAADNSNLVPTTSWVRANAGGAKTGDTVMTYRSVADPGWIVHNDGTIGDASSGATARANADAQNLFNLFWSNPNCTIAGGKGASAAADWAAHKALKLPPQVGRSVGVAGAGAGLTARNAGDAVGAETVSYSSSTGGNNSPQGIGPPPGGWVMAGDGHTHPFSLTVGVMQPTGFLYLHVKL